MKTAPILKRPLLSILLVALLNLGSAVWGDTIPFLFEPEDAAPPDTLLWATEPGVRYDLFSSDDLDAWDHVTGFPAMADSLVMSYGFPPEDRGFFQIVPIDEQPPVIVAQFPGADGFGVGRFTDLTIQLSDATSIAPDSIQLTVGSLGTFGQGAGELTFADNTITFDSGGDTALGAWGEIIAVSLTVADTLGNSGLLQWSFQLELESQVATNLFVFGSPAAQRAGQQVGPIATRALIGGPIRMGDPGDPWTIESVGPDRIVLAYTGATAPVFAVDGYLCNRTPASLDEIFYRKVTSTNDDSIGKKLTVFTKDVGLEEIITDGAFSTANEGLVFEVGADGTIVRAIERSADVSLGNLGYSLDGTTLHLKRQDGLDLLSVEFEQLHWWLNNCRFRTSIDLGLVDGLRRMEGVVEGDLDSAVIFNVNVALLGEALEDEIFDLPAASEPTLLVPLGPLAFALVKIDFKVRAEAEAAALLSFHAGYRQSGRVNGLGFRYDRPDFDWINNVNFSPTQVEPFSSQISGSLSLQLKLEPSVSFLVYGLAGAELALEPKAGVVFETDAQSALSGRMEAGVDVRLKPSGSALDWIRPQPSLSRTLVEGQWPLFSNQQSPSIISQPQNKVASIGSSVLFTCSVNQTTGVTWQWYQNGVAMPGQTKASLELANLAPHHAGVYSVRARVSGVTLQSTTASLTVLNNLSDLAIYFQYPIGDRQWKAEFRDYPAVSERNTLYPANPALDETTRAGKGAASGWYNYQDVGSWYPGYGIHPAEDWNKAGGDTGQPVFPVAGGKVVKISPANSGNIAGIGWDVVVEHRLAESIRKPGDSESCYSIYTHVSPRPDGSLVASLGDESAFPYQVGSSVSLSRPLGYIGATTGVSPHLHLEMRKKLPGKTITDSTSLYTVTGNGYFSDSSGAAAAFAAMQAEGIIDPSDFIDDHGGAATNNPATDGFALIPGGSFQMGDQSNPLVGFSDVRPVHSVYVSAFYMGKYEVTKELWDEVRAWGASNGYTDLPAGNGSYASKGANHPVHSISWYAMVKWCNARSQKEGLAPCYTVAGATYKTGSSTTVVCNWSANGYRLPTEAEWEKAARGGLSGKNFPWGDTITHSQANYYSSRSYSYDLSPTRGYHPTYAVGGNPYSSPVGSFAPNGHGLYDMAGNMWERCWDWWGSSYYSTSPGTDPRGPASGSYRVYRGGSWSDVANDCRAAYRIDYSPTNSYDGVGLRIARSSVP